VNLFAAYYQIDLREPLIYPGLGVIVVVVSIAVSRLVVHGIPYFRRRDENDTGKHNKKTRLKNKYNTKNTKRYTIICL